MMHYRRQADEQTVRTALHNLYRECRGFGRKSVLTPEQDTMLKLNEFMERRYEFRYNQLMGDLEYRQRDSIHFYFHVMDQRARNSVAMDALQEGLRVWDRDVNRYLTSNRVPLYNPVEEYLCGVGRWDGKDRIRALAGLVPCNNPYWRELFYRWFLNMVAHWRGLGNRMHANSTSPLLIGAQGYRKSTFCRIILPPELRFGYTDSLDFGSKRDAEMYLGRFLLVNIDEFDQVSIHQQGFLKHLLQKPVANLRKPYGSSIQEIRRYASFIGTSNHKDLLTDSSGSRRFVCVEVTAPIDTNVTINYRQLYAQAMQAIRSGERYWFNDKDEAVLKENNREFEQISPIEQLFHCHFRLPQEGEEGEWMSPIQILEILHAKNSDIKLTDGHAKHFGRILDTNVTINYRQLYAQAMQAIRSGERYWFNDKDEAVLKENNREFEQISPIEQLFHCHFRLPQEGEEGEWMSPIQILEILHAKNSDIKLTDGHAKHFGRILKKNNLESRHTQKGVVYRIIKS